MRPHLLELEAFGAFPGAVRLDLDEVGRAGLVLLCGDTGGGKTTLLDALGFALYGVVPGERQKAREDLRSHHAPAGATARVRLEFTARGRRLRVTRTPAQVRPKRRGSGTITENPTALLESWDGTLWTPLAQRPEDVGLEIARLLGMDAAQFFQVVVLPQGRFAAFLQAEHREREKLLKQLFQVDRFERAEQWLADRAAAALEAVGTASTQLGLVAARVAQVAGVDVPTELEAAPDWAESLAAVAEQERAGATAATAALLASRTVAEQALARAQALATRQQLRREAEAELTVLEEQAPVLAGLRAERDAAERARPVQVAAQAAEQADRLLHSRSLAAASALDAADRLRAGTGCPAGSEPLWAATGAAGLQALADSLHAEGGRLESMAELESRAAVQQAAGQAAEATAAAHEAELAIVREQLRESPARRAAAAAQHAAGAAAERALPQARLDARQAVEQADLAAAVVAATAERQAVGRAVEDGEASARRAREAADEVRVSRVDAIIGRLARMLVEDTPCPVCGSLAHPDVAELSGQDSGEQAERAAENAAAAAARAVADLRIELGRLDERLAGLRQRQLPGWADEPAGATGPPGSELPQWVAEPASATGPPDPEPGWGDGSAGALGSSGSEPGQGDGSAGLTGLPGSEPGEAGGTVGRPARLDPAVAAGQVAELERRAAAGTSAARLLDALHAEAEQWAKEIVRLELLARQEHKQAGQAAAEAAELRSRLRAELGDGVELAERRRQLAALAQAAGCAATALAAVDSAQQAAAAAGATVDLLLRAAGFSDRLGLQAAVRDEQWAVAAGHRLQDHRDQLASVQVRLRDHDVPLEPPAPVESCAAALREAAEVHEEALAVARVVTERAGALAMLVPAYGGALAALGPLRASAAELKGLSEVVAGRSPNRLSMPLSTYVLAARLEEVAEAASRRLGRMSGGRYSLSHSDVSRDRRSRAGLGLQVEDGWTGRCRDTATLSGGETFMTALALALGLADVVTAEAGGHSIDALFVDEGFGTLDAGSLDQVMDVLDELRSGGRLVAIVSHVADLRQRIPTQVRVVKGTAGSHLELA